MSKSPIYTRILTFPHLEYFAFSRLLSAFFPRIFYTTNHFKVQAKLYVPLTLRPVNFGVAVFDDH